MDNHFTNSKNSLSIDADAHRTNGICSIPITLKQMSCKRMHTRVGLFNGGPSDDALPPKEILDLAGGT